MKSSVCIGNLNRPCCYVTLWYVQRWMNFTIKICKPTQIVWLVWKVFQRILTLFKTHTLFPLCLGLLSFKNLNFECSASPSIRDGNTKFWWTWRVYICSYKSSWFFPYMTFDFCRRWKKCYMRLRKEYPQLKVRVRSRIKQDSSYTANFGGRVPFFLVGWRFGFYSVKKWRIGKIRGVKTDDIDSLKMWRSSLSNWM